MGSLKILVTKRLWSPMVTWEKWDAINLVVLHTFNQTLNRASLFHKPKYTVWNNVQDSARKLTKSIKSIKKPLSRGWLKYVWVRKNRIKTTHVQNVEQKMKKKIGGRIRCLTLTYQYLTCVMPIATTNESAVYYGFLPIFRTKNTDSSPSS